MANRSIAAHAVDARHLILLACGLLLSPAATLQAAESVQPFSVDRADYGAGTYVPPPLREGPAVFFVAPDGDDRNPGTLERPWASPIRAATALRDGQIAYLRGGTYPLTARIMPQHSGVTLAAYPGETPVIDASGIATEGPSGITAGYGRDLGALFIHGVDRVTVAGLTVVESRGTGISICTSDGTTLIGNTTRGSFSSGINTNSILHHGCKATDIRILRNTVLDATTLRLRSADYPAEATEAPHEAISIMGADGFELAYNYIAQSAKEGFDIKETSRNGVVRHNLVEDIVRQCYYVDSWGGVLDNIELYGNVGRHCGFAGFALSTEEGERSQNIHFHHNLLYGNGGSGIYISRFALDKPRQHLRIHHNTVDNNGHGKDGEWMRGGFALLTANLTDAEIHENIFSNNAGFQSSVGNEYIGAEGLPGQNIVIRDNHLFGPQEPTSMHLAEMLPCPGHAVTHGDPGFVDPTVGDYRLRPDSPARGKGAYAD
ncbi:MAG: right-handed parallel beta-helix repeat-containing protein [Thiotrichales bacterium]